MKKCLGLFITIIVIFASQNLYAQAFHTGIQAGINGTQVNGDSYGGFDKAGIFAGAYVNHYFQNKLGFQFEINYSQEGSRKNADPSKGDYSYFLSKLNYIQIPLALHYDYSKKFDFEAGLYYGKLLNVYIENEIGPVSTDNLDFKDYDFGGLLGLYYKLSPHFAAHVRSFTSFLPVLVLNSAQQNIGLSNKLSNRGWYNLCLTFALSYNINVGKDDKK